MLRVKEKVGNDQDLENNPKFINYKSKCQTEIELIDEAFHQSTALLLESYEDYLKNIEPSPQFLPVTISIKIPEKDIEIKNVRIDRFCTIGDIKKLLVDYMSSVDPIAEFSNSNIFVLYPSFSSSNESKRDKDGILLIDENVPILQHNPEPGALLLLKGHLICKSEEPKQCFKTTYKEGELMDYFVCRDCNIKWICKNCCDDCHAGHNTKLFMLQHKPTYACCYCPRTKKCKLNLI